MLLMQNYLALSLFVFSLTSSLSAQDFKDDFSDPELKIRQALRGEWTYQNGVAHCVADAELYKKFKNHGPILRWPAEFTDGTVEFEFQPEKCDRVVVTLNEKGHVFRMLFHEPERSRFFGWVGQSSKTNKAKSLMTEGIPSAKDLSGKWTKAKLIFKGNTAQISYGEFKTTIQHESVGRKKGEFTISFAGGELKVRNVQLSTTKPKAP